MTWLLTTRILRARWVWRGAVPSLVVAALLVAVAMVMSAVSLTAEQRRELEFGDYALSWRLPQPTFLGQPVSLPDGAESHGTLVLITDRLSVLTGGRLIYLEGPWATAPPPGRYDLTSGRWPRVPGEVVVTQALADDDHVLAVSPDVGRLTVVGEVDNRYSSTAEVLAAPGTWATARAADPASAMDLAATVNVYTGPLDPAEAADLGALLNVAEPFSRDAPDNTVSWSEFSPMAFRIPSAVLPALVGAFAALFGRRRLLRTSAALVAVGTPRRYALTALALAGGLALTVGAALGAIIGISLGFGGGLLAARAAGHPYVFSVPGSLVYAAVTVPPALGWAALVVALRPERHRARTLSPIAAKLRRSAIYAAQWALGAVSIYLVVTGRTVAQSMMLVACLAALATFVMPRLLKRATSRLQAHDPATRWGLRALGAPGGAAVGALVLLVALIAPPLAALSLATMSDSRMRAEVLATVGPGQVAVSGAGGTATAAPPSATAVAESVLAGLPRHRLVWVDGFLPFFGPFVNASVLVVEDAADASVILGGNLTSAELEVLREGGLLHWGNASLDTVSVDSNESTEVVEFTTVRRAASVSQEWTFQAGGVITRASADAAGLPLLEGGTLYSNVSPADATRLTDLLLDRGIDRRVVEAYHPPEPPVPVLAAVVSAGLLCLVVVLVATAAASARVAGLRPVVAQFVTHGASRRQVRSMVAIEPLATTVAAFAIGIGSVAVGVGVLMMRIPFLTIDLRAWPTLVAALVVAVCAGQAVGVLVALRGARPGYSTS